MTTSTTTTSHSAAHSTSPSERPAGKRHRAAYRQSALAGPAGARGASIAGSAARRLASVILEVLAGVQTPTSAAEVLGIRLPRYYLLEQRAVAGLVSACEPRPKGRTISSDRQIARLGRELAVCRRELGRQQALARAAQRVLGLKIPATTSATSGNGKSGSGTSAGSAGKKSRKRRPVARALRAARVLKTDSSTHPDVTEVQIPVSDGGPASGGNHSARQEGTVPESSGAQGG